MKNKGFTLVELLTMLVVLGIIMLVAVPNITGILDSHKTNIILNDAATMLDNAKVKVTQNNKMEKPKDGECIALSLQYIDDSQSVVKGPNDGIYNRYESFVLMKRERSQYYYYVRLVEEKEGKNPYGIHIKTPKELEDVSNVEALSLLGLDKIPDIDPTKSYTADERKAIIRDRQDKITANVGKLNADGSISGICTNRVVNYY